MFRTFDNDSFKLGINVIAFMKYTVKCIFKTRSDDVLETFSKMHLLYCYRLLIIYTSTGWFILNGFCIQHCKIIKRWYWILVIYSYFSNNKYVRVFKVCSSSLNIIWWFQNKYLITKRNTFKQKCIWHRHVKKT